MAEYGKRCRTITRLPLHKERIPSSRTNRNNVHNNGSVFFITGMEDDASGNELVIGLTRFDMEAV